MPIKRNLDKLISSSINSNVNGQQSNTSFDIEGLFKPKYDAKGCFEITLRFLPPVAAEDSQYIENRAHWLKQITGKNIAIDCLKRFKAEGSTKGMPCPICDYNNIMFKRYPNKDAKGQYGDYNAHKLPTARAEYMCNVLIIKNANEPSTEGQVFRFKYGKQIKDMIDKVINDTGKRDDQGEPIPPINPYSYYGVDDADVISGETRPGANFVWIGKPGDYGTDYKESHFNKPSRIAKSVDGVNSLGQAVKKLVPLTDAEIDVIESRLYTLKEHEKTLAKCRDYNTTIKYVKEKCAIDLNQTLNAEFNEAAESYQGTTASAPAYKVNNTVEVNDDEMFAGTPLETKKPEPAPAPAPRFDSAPSPRPTPAPAPAPTPAPAPKVEQVVDEDDFFARLGQDNNQ